MTHNSVQTETLYRWDTLPAIPDATGFAGSFAGVSNDALIVAGGANFPNGGTPWNGGKKTWYDQIFVLEKGSAAWKEAGKLPRPLGYGVSISAGKGLIVIGGSNAEGHYSDVFMLAYENDSITTTPLPALPAPLANTCGALTDSCIYVAGGTKAPDATVTEHVFYMLDLKAKDSGWQTLPAWPGPSRMLAVAGSLDGAFYLFSGTKLQNGKRVYVNDAYRYSKSSGWAKLADMPQATVAAPTPAMRTDAHTLAVLGGDNGAQADSAGVLQEKHPGFSDAVLAYDSKEDQWRQAGKIFTKREPDAVAHPNNSIWAPVTTAAVQWNGWTVIPGGEVRPGTRTPNVLKAEILK